MNPEILAKLVGLLTFQVDTTGLHKFQQAMKTAQIQMRALSKEADTLSAKLGKKLGIKVDPVAQNKLSASVAKNLDREAKAEIVVQKLRRQTFQAELAGQKLLFAGKKESAHLVTADVRHQQALAVLASKQQKTTLDSLKVRGQEIKNTDLLTQAKQKQTRGELIHQQIIQRTANLKAQELKAMSGTQRIQQAMNNAAESGRRAALKFTQQQAKSRVNDQRQTERFQMSQQRFKWQEARQQQWVANQNKPQPTSFLGLSGAPLALTGVTAGLAGIVAAVEALGTRIQARQDGVQDAESFNNVFKTISPKADIQQLLRERFISSQSNNAGVIDLDTAKDFRVMVSGMLEAGKTIDQAMKAWETRQKVFAITGTSSGDNRELNKQVNQLQSDGTGTAQDAEIINNRMPMIVPYVVRAFMEESGIKDYQKGLVAFNKSLKAGAGIKFGWYETAMANLVAQHQPDLERNKQSVTNAQRQNDNFTFLTETERNSDADLTGAMKANVEAHRQMTLAMIPVNEALLAFDTILVKVSTWMLKWFTEADSQSSGKKADALSPDKPAIDPASFNGQPLDGEVSPIQDPVDKFWNKFFGKSDVQHDPETPKVDVSDMTDKWLPIIRNMPAPLTANDMQRMNETQKANQTLPGRDGDKTASEPATVNTNNSVTNNITMPPIELKVTINAPAGASPDLDLYAMPFRRAIRAEVQNMFQKYMPAEVH